MNARILMVGTPRDPTFRHTLSTPRPEGREVVVLNIDRFADELGIVLEGELGERTAVRISEGDRVLDFASIDACYARFIEPPPTDGTTDDMATDARRWARFRLLQIALAAAPYLVVNRPGSGESNDTKPVQTALLGELGFTIPSSCTTNDPEEARAFLESCPDGAIYKSNSGNRSIVQAIDPDDLDHLDLLARCPVFFQERIRGADIRVHVIGNRCHAVAIRSDEVDYRYDRSGNASEAAFEIPDDLAALCITATASLGLAFSGIDLIQRDDSGEFVALEANPMPGYHGYDLTLGGAISASLWDYLAQA